MKFLLSILVIIGNLNVLLANNDICRQNDLILLQLRSEFANLKIKLDEHINAIQAENKVLKEANDNQETELKKLRQEINDTSSEINTVKDKSLIPIVGFSAHLSSTVTTTERVVFDTVITNQGEGYDNSTGIFTAPYTGLYFFSAHVCSQRGLHVQYTIFKEDKELTFSLHNDDRVDSCSSASTIDMVNKTERVWVEGRSANTVFYNRFGWNAFSGSLLNI